MGHTSEYVYAYASKLVQSFSHTCFLEQKCQKFVQKKTNLLGEEEEKESNTTRSPLMWPQDTVGTDSASTGFLRCCSGETKDQR